MLIRFDDATDAAATTTPRKRSRHKPKRSKKTASDADEKPEHPLADPNRPIPNLACSDAFEFYYKTQYIVEPGWEWARFINTLHQPLPITFRVQPHGSLGEECRKSLAEMLQRDSHMLPEVTPLPWCDSWAIGISKEALKVSAEPQHVALQSWIAKWAALGALSRQAIESMVPVALLRIEPHHACLDLGDGTTRKNPSIWHRWSVEYALEMHRLQLQIALRGVALLKVGGLMAYSTCSLNPCENESVVAALIQRGGGALEIVDCADRLPELNRARGISTWTVLDDDMREHASYAELMGSKHLNKALKRRFMPTMWPPPPKPPPGTKPLHLERCLRLLPHLANMGGFFVTLIKKLRMLPPEALDTMSSQLGLDEESVRKALGAQLMCASDKATVLSRVAPDVAAICAAGSAGSAAAAGEGGGGGGGPPRAPRPRKLRVISAGCVLARRTRGGTFQPTVEGARALAPFATKRRTLTLKAADALALIDRASQPSKRRRGLPLSELSPKAAAKARALPPGPCLLTLRPPDEGRPALTVPARRMRDPESLRLLLLFTAGLEFRPAAMLHSARSWLEDK